MMIIPFCILAIEDDSDRAFMTEIFELYGGLMYRKAKNMLKDNHHAEDMVSEAFLSLIANIQTLRGMDRCKIMAYVVSTIRNTCLDFIRKRNRQGKFMFLDGEMTMNEIPADMDILDQLIRDADTEALKNAIKRLPERQYQLLQWKYFDLLSDAEIAESIGIKADSVRNALTLARRKAARLLKVGVPV